VKEMKLIVAIAIFLVCCSLPLLLIGCDGYSGSGLGGAGKSNIFLFGILLTLAGAIISGWHLYRRRIS
jgi:hypothetical protein